MITVASRLIVELPTVFEALSGEPDISGMTRESNYCAAGELAAIAAAQR